MSVRRALCTTLQRFGKNSFPVIMRIISSSEDFDVIVIRLWKLYHYPSLPALLSVIVKQICCICHRKFVVVALDPPPYLVLDLLMP